MSNISKVPFQKQNNNEKLDNFLQKIYILNIYVYIRKGRHVIVFKRLLLKIVKIFEEIFHIDDKFTLVTQNKSFCKENGLKFM